MSKVMQDSKEAQSQSRYFAIKQEMAPVLDEANKKFNDAIYRVQNNLTKTAASVWADLKVAQSQTGFASGLQCVSLLNELTRRGQIADDWRG